MKSMNIGFLADNDGGWYNSGNGQYYEVGSQPAYCISQHGAPPAAGSRWWVVVTTVCAGGN